MEKIFLLLLLLNTVHGLNSKIENLECSPNDHKIHLSKSSPKRFHILCTLTVNINSSFYSAWDIDKVRNSPGSYIRSRTQVSQNSTLKNIIIESEVFIDQASSVMKSVVRLTLAVSVDSVELQEVIYTVSCGTDSSLILICVFTSVGLLSISGALVSLFIIKRRRERAPAPLTQPDEDLWADVDLSDSNTGFQGDMIDNLTSISNENYSERPISKFISQISATRANQDPEFVDADDLPCLRRATVNLGGGADHGAGQLTVRDYEELEVVQEDLGSGYTTVRKIQSGEYGFLPTTSLIFD